MFVTAFELLAHIVAQGEEAIKSRSAGQCQRFARAGVPPSLRPGIWTIATHPAPIYIPNLEHEHTYFDKLSAEVKSPHERHSCSRCVDD